jgi:lipoprotein-releasing system permease protein
MKGVENNYDWSFIQQHLKQGRIPDFKQQPNAIVLSAQLAQLLHFKIGDEVSAFYVKNQPVLRKYVLAGIFSTGLEEYDKKLVFCALPEVQKMNDWGLQCQMELVDSLSPKNTFILKTLVTGQEMELYFDWGEGADIYTGIYVPYLKDSIYRAVISSRIATKNKLEVLDTCQLKISLPNGVEILRSEDLYLSNGKFNLEYSSENDATLQTKKGLVRFTFKHSSGKSSEQVGGIEVRLNHWSDLEAVAALLKNQLEMRPTKDGELLAVKSVLENESELFAWLSFLDYNVIIILVLMLVIGIINIGSALLVLIVMRTNFIGLMKAMGANNWDIRKIFLWQAAFLVGRGLLIGNIIGVSLCFIQMKFALFSLDPAVYFLDKVPIELTFVGWLGVNVLTFAVCMISLLLPSLVVTRISPSRAIKFN